MERTREIQVGAEYEGWRLDRLIAKELELSRGHVRRLLAQGRISLVGAPTAKGALLRAGDRVRIAEFRHPDEGPLPEPELELALLAERRGLLAFDKPAGMPSQPLEYEETGTAVNAVLGRHPELVGVGRGGLEPGLLHRLDILTSGVLVFASDDPSWQAARELFRAGRVHKRYLALVHGRLSTAGELTLRLAQAGPRARVVDRGGRVAHTRWQPLRSDPSRSLVRVEMSTGVTHQIRATLAQLGHPIVGDRLYGSSSDEPRHWLHAESIRIGDFQAHSPPPERLMAS